jgi:hypothetical protein
MKVILLNVILFCSLVIQTSFAQNVSLERKITRADLLWKINEMGQAIDLYRNILSGNDLPEEYRSLVYMRLAEALFQSGLKEESTRIISELKSLPVVPAHHILMADELLKKIEGIRVSDSTVIDDNNGIAARLFVTSSKNKSEKTGETYTSIEDALNALLILKKTNLPEGAIEILLTDSYYNIGKTIKIGTEFSGNKRNPIIIRSGSPGIKVVLNGGMPVKTWKKEKNANILSRLPEKSRNSVIVADLKSNHIPDIDSLVFGGFSSRRASKAIGSRFTSFPVPELFFKGNPQMMARWPNYSDTVVSLADFKDPRVLGWASEKDLWLHGYWKYMWADAYEKVKSISIKDTVINLQPPLNNYGFEKSKWHVVNALSEIDMPGEWCLSVEKGRIWYYPPVNFDPDECTLSVAGPVFEVQNCDYLTIKDIDIEFVRGDGLVFLDCNNLSLLNCSVINGSGYGVRIINGTGHLVHSCQIKSMGRGGIDIISGNIRQLMNSGTVIENCRISDLSRIDRTYTPAILLEGVGIKVRHCLFSGIPSSAIRLEGNDMLVELNEFEKCVVESDDQGAIDVFGNPLYRGNIIRWNFFHDIGIPNLHMAAGIRLDDAICGFSIYENLFIRSSNNLFGGIQIHGGNENYIEGNIFSDCHAAISQSAWGDKRWESTLSEKGHPVYAALNFYDWQSNLWQSRYPALKTLTTGGTDRNYAVDNLLINGKTIFLRTSPKFLSLNNEMITKKQALNRPADFKRYVGPWQSFPLERIGPY